MLVIDTRRLKGEIVACGYTQNSFAAKIGMPESTFYSKIKRGVFNSDEIAKMINVLHLKDPTAIFFINFVAQ